MLVGKNLSPMVLYGLHVCHQLKKYWLEIAAGIGKRCWSESHLVRLSSDLFSYHFI